MTLRAHDARHSRPPAPEETWTGGTGHCAQDVQCHGSYGSKCACGAEVREAIVKGIEEAE